MTEQELYDKVVRVIELIVKSEEKFSMTVALKRNSLKRLVWEEYHLPSCRETDLDRTYMTHDFRGSK